MEETRESSHMLWSRRTAGEWAEGYPLGNGRLGAMVLGDPLRERVSLNHDRLWRQFWRYQEHGAAAMLPELRRLIAAGRWNEAHDLMVTRIPVSSQALYLNPFVPVGDLGIYPFHGKDAIGDYRRSLDLDSAVAEVAYAAAGVTYRREYLASWPQGLIAIRLSASQAGRVRGEVTLSRLLDPDCDVGGSSRPGEVVLDGVFEEGVRFAAVVRVVQRGGRLTGGRRVYLPPSGQVPPRDLGGLQFIFRDKDYPHDSIGVSSSFDCCDEVLLLVAVATQDEAGDDPAGWCRRKLDAAPTDFTAILDEHVRDHRRLYRRVRLKLGAKPGAERTESAPEDLIALARRTGRAPAPLVELMYNMGRYVAIASGRPLPKGQPAKAPINLQGLWNQDRRPAWDCDYHLDLNVEMCYWPLHMANLGELLPPMAEWFAGLLPQARRVAADLYGCRGALWSGVCDLRNCGNVDDLCFAWTGAGPWVAQILWQHWEYSADRGFLAGTLYPLLREMGRFYEDFLVEDARGRLVPVPSASPEMGIKGRKRYSAISSPSTMDLELIREVFSHLLAASELLGVDEADRLRWRAILGKVPLPAIDANGCLQEWLEPHEPIDPSHRHRSPLIGLCPGDRISREETPEHYAAARRLLAVRQQSRDTTCALASSWDTQFLARFQEGEAALAEIDLVARSWLIDNILLSICDWHDDAKTLNWFPGRKVYQIEASIGMVGAISEMLLQDRGGFLRLLPALPAAWSDGEVTGLRARGGFEVGLRWSGGRLGEARILSLRGERLRLAAVEPATELEVRRSGIDGEPLARAGAPEFPTHPGETYLVTPRAPDGPDGSVVDSERSAHAR